MRTGFADVTAGSHAVRDAVVYVHPRGDHQVRNFGADGGDDIAGQAGAVLVAAAERAGTAAGAEQFAEQVAVALLDVDEVEANATGHPGGRDVGVDQPAQGIVIEQGIGRIDTGERIEEGVVVTDKGCKVITLFPAEELFVANAY